MIKIIFFMNLTNLSSAGPLPGVIFPTPTIESNSLEENSVAHDIFPQLSENLSTDITTDDRRNSNLIEISRLVNKSVKVFILKEETIGASGIFEYKNDIVGLNFKYAIERLPDGNTFNVVFRGKEIKRKTKLGFGQQSSILCFHAQLFEFRVNNIDKIRSEKLCIPLPITYKPYVWFEPKNTEDKGDFIRQFEDRLKIHEKINAIYNGDFCPQPPRLILSSIDSKKLSNNCVIIHKLYNSDLSQAIVNKFIFHKFALENPVNTQRIGKEFKFDDCLFSLLQLSNFLLKLHENSLVHGNISPSTLLFEMNDPSKFHGCLGNIDGLSEAQFDEETKLSWVNSQYRYWPRSRHEGWKIPYTDNYGFVITFIESFFSDYRIGVTKLADNYGICINVAFKDNQSSEIKKGFLECNTRLEFEQKLDYYSLHYGEQTEADRESFILLVKTWYTILTANQLEARILTEDLEVEKIIIFESIQPKQENRDVIMKSSIITTIYEDTKDLYEKINIFNNFLLPIEEQIRECKPESSSKRQKLDLNSQQTLETGPVGVLPFPTPVGLLPLTFLVPDK